LYRDSTISNKSLTSVSFKGYRSHSSIISNLLKYRTSRCRNRSSIRGSARDCWLQTGR
jgi:hypothetical protein